MYEVLCMCSYLIIIITIYVYLIRLNYNYINSQKVTHYFIHLSCVFSFEYFQSFLKYWEYGEEKRKSSANFIIVHHNHELDFVIRNQVQCKSLHHTRYDMRQNKKI